MLMLDAAGWSAVAAGLAAIAAIGQAFVANQQLKFQRRAYDNSISPDLVLTGWEMGHLSGYGVPGNGCCTIKIANIINMGAGLASNIKIECTSAISGDNEPIITFVPAQLILAPGQETALNGTITFGWRVQSDGEVIRAALISLTVTCLDTDGNEHIDIRSIWIQPIENCFHNGEMLTPGMTVIHRKRKILSAREVQKRNRRAEKAAMKRETLEKKRRASEPRLQPVTDKNFIDEIRKMLLPSSPNLLRKSP